MANVIGPDVSFYQDDAETPQGIAFDRMRRAAEFVIIRAGQNLWPDPDFKYNWRSAKLAGLPRGSYWFYDSRANPKRQAEKWFEQFEGDLGELPLFADFEESYGGPYSGWPRWYDFLERLKQLIGDKQIGIYTAYYYWTRYAPNALRQPQPLEYFHQYPLWIANYGAIQPKVPRPWSLDEWLFWQYTETGDGRLYGVESRGIDLNYFRGDVEAFRLRFGLPAPEPTPGPTPGTGRMFLATTRLKVRESPATDALQVGTLETGDTVEELSASTDRSWLKIIRRLDALTGWSSSAYLTQISGPELPAPTTTGRQFRAKTRLRVREGPGTTYTIIAVLDTGDLVDEVEATGDRTWLKIWRQRDGLIGWSSSDFLENLQPVPPLPAPAPQPAVEAWYRVKGITLNVREGPGLQYKTVGVLKKDDTLPADAVSPDKSWVHIQRLDGLTGWSHQGFLELIGSNRPRSLRQLLFPGTTYFRKELISPRPLVIHVLAIDLLATKIEFLVTPQNGSTGIVCTRTTSQFLTEFAPHIAINGDGYSYLPQPAGSAPVCSVGDAVRPNGFAASKGVRYPGRVGPTLYINQYNEVTFGVEKGRIYNAVSGDRMVLKDGKPIPTLAINGLHPRTAIGLSRNGRNLLLMVVDGRQPGYSEGVDLAEVANHLVAFGAYTGCNMDGGGSSAIVIRDRAGRAVVLNSPIDSGVPGKERAVANHLGVFFR